MRIIVLNDHGSVTGGAAQVAIASLNALADLGFDVTFVSSVPPVDTRIDQAKVRTINFGMHELISNPSRRDAALYGLWDSRCAAMLGQLLNEYDPINTIIHLHTWTKSLTASVVRETRCRGFKVVITCHDYFAICPNGGLYNFREQQHCALTPMSLSCLSSNCDARNYMQKVWRFGRQIVQQQLAGLPRDVEHFISISDFSEALLRPLLPCSANIHRVRNPINIEHMPASNPGNNQSFSFIGRLSPEKGGWHFASAARISGVSAMFAGRGIEEPKIKEAYQSAQLLGWLDTQAVIRTIRESRALVFPSLWPETQGMVVMEAAALGIPAIVSDECAAIDTVCHEETGLLFKNGDVEDLAKCLKMLNENPDTAALMGKNAYERYWSNPCTLEDHLKELLACYSHILEQG